MTTNIASALAAYAKAATRGEAGMAPRPAAGEGFAALVKGALEGAAETAKAGEAASLKALAGQADLSEVVVAVTNAEVTLQTVVAIRDRVIQAYQDIIRMPL